jgi:hypothetical protein
MQFVNHLLRNRNNSVINIYIEIQNKEKDTMYTKDEMGVMNNYAVEPEMYFAVYPSVEQQRSYLFQGTVAVLLVATTLLTALAVS